MRAVKDILIVVGFILMIGSAGTLEVDEHAEMVTQLLIILMGVVLALLGYIISWHQSTLLYEVIDTDGRVTYIKGRKVE